MAKRKDALFSLCGSGMPPPVDMMIVWIKGMLEYSYDSKRTVKFQICPAIIMGKPAPQNQAWIIQAATTCLSKYKQGLRQNRLIVETAKKSCHRNDSTLQ